MKHDGYRTLIIIDGHVRAFARNAMSAIAPLWEDERT